MSIFSHVVENDHEQMLSSFTTWKKTGCVTNEEVLFKRKDGTTFPVLLSATNQYGINGKIIGSNTIIRDISELRILRKVEKTKKELEKKRLTKRKICRHGHS